MEISIALNDFEKSTGEKKWNEIIITILYEYKSGVYLNIDFTFLYTSYFHASYT